MSTESIFYLTEMPFCIGACQSFSNPHPLPNTYPIELCLNRDLGRLELASSNELEELLATAYSFGVEMGTPSDDTDLGKPYVMDFVDFINSHALIKGRALEIGAGVGFLSRVLRDSGWVIDSIEPGTGYAGHWARHEVEVINEFFPSPLAKGPYDLIVFYTVLEHIKDTRSFLRTVAEHLAPEGKIILSVPDCSLEIEMGDPSMLLHEHFQYFTPAVLIRTLIDAGFSSTVARSSFGRSLYACATLSMEQLELVGVEDDIVLLLEYADRVSQLKENFESRLNILLNKGTVGLFCPARALTLLPQTAPVRFFDDSSSLYGKYYPPFLAIIENREDLLRNPPDSLIIMSRTFGRTLLKDLKPQLPNTEILLIDGISERAVSTV